MATYAYHLRRLEAVKLVVRLEGMKDKADRELDVDKIVEKAKTIDTFVKELS